jgi:phospholipid/cholesterol/gamma-HCH transport system substrate-binding protein
MQPVTVNRSRLVPAALATCVLVVAVLAVVGVRAALSTPTYTVTADFPEAPGVYVGNHVDVLGIPVGSVTAVTPHPTYVSVVMHVDSDVKLPADAIAALMAPDIVNDRYIQLDPVYRHGAAMAANAVIPMRRTALPQSVDQTISLLDQLIQALGPTGANKNGIFSRFVHDVAQTVGGNGPSFHTTVLALGKALEALSNDGPTITSLLDNAGAFTGEAAANDQEFQSFANDLASASALIASDSSDIGATLSSLKQVLTQVTSYVDGNVGSIGTVLSNLNVFTAKVLSQQQQLSQAFAYGGLALQNLNNAIVPGPNGSTSLRIRYDPSLDTKSFVQQICGQELPRILELGAQQAKSSELNLACAASAALSQMDAPPDANEGPDLSMSALIGAEP